MKKLKIIVLLTCFFSSNVFAQETENINKNFQTYNQAIIQKNGLLAAEHVSKSTLNLYAQLGQLALYGDKAEIKKQPLSNQVNVLLMRHLIDCHLLQKLDGQTLFAYTIINGWVTKESVEFQSLGTVKSEDNKSSAPLLYKNKKIGANLGFVFEDSQWKVDLNSIVESSSKGLKWAALIKGQSQEKFLELLVTEAKKSPMDFAIWDKPICAHKK